MIAKSKRPQAERAGEWCLAECFACIRTRRALRTKFAKVDFWGSDVMGMRKGGTKVFAQVTCGGNTALSVRRKKLEKYPWHPTDTVIVLQMVERQDVADQRKTAWFFRVHRLEQYFHQYKPVELNQITAPEREWSSTQDVIPISPHWFKAMKNETKED